MKQTIGFIGQGFIGKNYANDFEDRGFDVVRYALEEPHINNKERIAECDIVFIAVPTPTTPEGFDCSTVENVLSLVGEGKIAVIKSTILPGTTKTLQKAHSDRLVFYSPEFLSEATAAHDAANPFSNIVGMPEKDEAHLAGAKRIHDILPKAPFALTCDSTEAEIIKYTHNISAYTQIVTFNMLYDLTETLGVSWDVVEKAAKADPLISNRYASPLHKSGRGAGGHCFIKDFEAFIELYQKAVNDVPGLNALAALRDKNIALLRGSKKDLDLLEDVYGKAGPDKSKA